MNKIIQVLMLLAMLMPSLSAMSQDELIEMDDKFWDYRMFRNRSTVPPYGLAKVQHLIKGIVVKDSDSDFGTLAISNNDFNALNPEEQFTYVMIHPENYSQNCDASMPMPDEDKKIFGELGSWGNEESWSDRQIQYLKANRALVMRLIQESTTRSKHMGVNYKDALVEINAWEMIPFIIKYYEGKRKDKDALTVLNKLMHKGKFEAFMKSTSYTKLYGDENNYMAFLEFNKANEALIIERATTYYKQMKNRK